MGNFNLQGPSYSLKLCFCQILWPFLLAAWVQQASGQCIITLAGPADIQGAPATTIQLYPSPFGLASDGAGGVYIADTTANVMRRLFANATIYTAVGMMLASGTSAGNGGPGTLARIGYVGNLASDAAGGVFLAVRSHNAIRRLYGNGTIVLVAGNYTVGSTGDGGPATLATLSSPYGAVPDTVSPGSGGVFIADTGNSVLR